MTEYSLLELTSRLAADPAEKALYQDDPAGYLEGHGYELEPNELHVALAHVADSAPPEVAATIDPAGGLDQLARLDLAELGVDELHGFVAEPIALDADALGERGVDHFDGLDEPGDLDEPLDEHGRSDAVATDDLDGDTMASDRLDHDAVEPRGEPSAPVEELTELDAFDEPVTEPETGVGAPTDGDALDLDDPFSSPGGFGAGGPLDDADELAGSDDLDDVSDLVDGVDPDDFLDS